MKNKIRKPSLRNPLRGVVPEHGLGDVAIRSITVMNNLNHFMMKIFFAAFFLMLNYNLSAQEIKKIKINELKSYIEKSDHPLIVNFWATYCVPCVHEIPYFQTETKKYKSDGVELILVSLDLPDFYPSKISAFAKKENYTSSILWLDESNADYFCPKIDKNWSGGIPSTLFVNNKNNYRKFFERQLTEPQVEENIKALVK